MWCGSSRSESGRGGPGWLERAAKVALLSSWPWRPWRGAGRRGERAREVARRRARDGSGTRGGDARRERA